MGKKQLHCLFIGQKSEIYSDLQEQLKALKLNIQLKQAGLKESTIASSLKRCRGACLVIISDSVNFSLEKLSDLVWRYSSDAVIVIVTNKTATTALKNPFNATQIAKLHIDRDSNESSLFVKYLVQYIHLKAEFRRCKRLLGTSEKRCQWLVDTSREPVAYVSRNMHLYANAAYLGVFGFDSIENLQATPVQELIVKDEFALYSDFINKQARHHLMDRALILTMQKTNGASFRGSLHAIPTVYKGRTCLQLWVHPVGQPAPTKEEVLVDHEVQMSNSFSDKHLEINIRDKKAEVNPFAVLYKPKAKEVRKKKSVDSSTILRDIIKRKEAKISTQKLLMLNKPQQKFRQKQNKDHHLVSLVVAIAQRQGINDLLFRSVDAHTKDLQSLFWDKVKLTRLLQIILKKKLDTKLIISLSDAVVSDEKFITWLAPGLKKIGKKASNLAFLIPCQCQGEQRRTSFKLIKMLRSYGCKIGLDDFRVSKEHIDALKVVRPDYVKMSLPWVREVEGNDSREVALGRLIRQLESNNMKVIAPCAFSHDMKKLFVLSGASFCQEKATKTG